MHYVVHASGLDPFIAIGEDGIREAVEDLYGAERVSFVRRWDKCLYVNVVVENEDPFELLAIPQEKIYGAVA